MKPLPWEYCECGCKRSTLSLGSLHLGLYNDLKGGYFLILGGHGPIATSRKFNTQEEADARARELLRNERKNIEAQLAAFDGAL